MKKYILLLSFLFVAAAMNIKAQSVAAYGFESFVGTYTEITDGTVIASGTQIVENTIFSPSSPNPVQGRAVTEYEGFDIGFNFLYNDIQMNRFVVGTHFFIVLGKDGVTADPTSSKTILSSFGTSGTYGTEGKRNVIGCNLNPNFVSETTAGQETVISYKLIGAAPDRVMVIQYKNMKIGTSSTTTTDFVAVNFQIRLYENSNIEFVYYNWEKPTGTSENCNAYVGISGSMIGDSHRRLYENSSAPSWLATVKDTRPNQTIAWRINSYPADGLTFKFIAPGVCNTPSNQPTNLVLTATTNSINGSFDVAASVDRYLVLMSESTTLSVNPSDGIYYAAGNEIGNALVISYSDAVTFTRNNLDASKTYYFTVFAANSLCSNGPKYNLVTPLSGSFTTMPSAPASLTVVENDYHTAKISTEANAAGNQILIALTNVPARNVQNPTQIVEGGTFGVPQGTYQVGDEIEGGGTVVYVGDSNDNIEIDELDDNMNYHLRAWSFNNSGDYSTTYSIVSFVTWGIVPFSTDYTRERLGYAPLGWDDNPVGFIYKQPSTWGTGSWMLTDRFNGSTISPAVMSLTSSWILLGEVRNRIDFRYYLSVPTFATFYGPLNTWEDESFLAIQVSTDGENFTTVYTVNGENAPVFGNQRTDATMETLRTTPFNTFNGQRVKIRILWNFTQTVVTHMEDIHIEQVGACDRTHSLAVNPNSLVDGNAEISWSGFDEEADLWEVRYRTLGDEPGEWTQPVETSENPYMMTGLPAVTDIEVQVRVKCSLSSTSIWESISFKTGYILPFTETFDDIANNTLPYGWKTENGTIGEQSTTFGTGMTIKNWAVNDNKLLIGSTTSILKDWVMLPMVYLGDGSYNYKLEFDFIISKLNENTIPANTYFAVVISEDGGTTWNTAGIMLNMPVTDENINNFNSHYSVNLAGKTGIIKLAFYFEGPSSNPVSIKVDNVSIIETCPPAINVVATEITATSAKIIWEGEDVEWLVFFREKGDTGEDFETNTAKILDLSDLENATTYEVGITRNCGENDDAKLVIIEFSTLATIPCDEPTDIEAVPSQYSVSIEWEGDAISYKVRIREAGAGTWTERTVEIAYIEITGLNPDTNYEYGIQTVCSAAEGDISDWVDGTFKTLAITCFPPTDIIVAPYYESAQIEWEGTATNYEFSYRVVGGEWGNNIAINGSKIYVLENLTRKTDYQLRLRSVCAVSDISVWSASIPFTTPDIPPCAYPIDLNEGDITTTTAELSWKSGNDQNLSWDLQYRIASSTNWIIVNDIDVKTYSLTDLIPGTNYLWRVRANCSEDRESSWATQREFTTVALPPCSAPINLSVSEITETSAELSWAAGNDQNLSWELRYSVAANIVWTNIKDLGVKNYLLENLTPNTAYLWTVRANCSYDRTSEWGTQNDFTTKDQGGISNNQKLPLTVYASGKMINIINPDNKYIENVQLFDINGKLIGDYSVKGVGNVLIPAIVVESVAIVKVIGKNEVESHKILNK